MNEPTDKSPCCNAVPILAEGGVYSFYFSASDETAEELAVLAESGVWDGSEFHGDDISVFQHICPKCGGRVGNPFLNLD